MPYLVAQNLNWITVIYPVIFLENAMSVSYLQKKAHFFLYGICRFKKVVE